MSGDTVAAYISLADTMTFITVMTAAGCNNRLCVIKLHFFRDRGFIRLLHFFRPPLVSDSITINYIIYTATNKVNCSFTPFFRPSARLGIPVYIRCTGGADGFVGAAAACRLSDPVQNLLVYCLPGLPETDI